MDTPRTDAECWNAPLSYGRHLEPRFVVDADFARTLERELAQANARIAELEKERDEYKDAAKSLDDMMEAWARNPDVKARHQWVLELQERAESAERDALMRAAEVCENRRQFYLLPDGDAPVTEEATKCARAVRLCRDAILALIPKEGECPRWTSR